MPGHRSHKLTDVNRGIIPGWDVNDGSLYHMPWMAGIFGYTIAAAAIGAATGALAAYVEQTRTRYAALGGPPVAANPAIQFRLADALAGSRGLPPAHAQHLAGVLRTRLRWHAAYPGRPAGAQPP